MVALIPVMVPCVSWVLRPNFCTAMLTAAGLVTLFGAPYPPSVMGVDVPSAPASIRAIAASIWLVAKMLPLIDL